MITVFFTTFEFSSLDVLIANIVKQLLIIVHSNSPPVVWEWSHIYYMAGGGSRTRKNRRNRRNRNGKTEKSVERNKRIYEQI